MRNFLVAMVCFIGFDFLWLGFVAKSFYLKELGELARIEEDRVVPIYWAAALVYLILAFGVCFFVLPRTGVDSSTLNTFITGAALGFTIYGVYDMTNLSTLKSWPLLLSFVDIAWGSVLTGTVAVITHAISDRW